MAQKHENLVLEIVITGCPIGYDLCIIKTCDFISKRPDAIWAYLNQESKLNFGSVYQKKAKVPFSSHIRYLSNLDKNYQAVSRNIS